jgi:uncharacterized RDD family membrane protein YckC
MKFCPECGAPRPAAPDGAAPPRPDPSPEAQFSAAPPPPPPPYVDPPPSSRAQTVICSECYREFGAGTKICPHPDCRAIVGVAPAGSIARFLAYLIDVLVLLIPLRIVAGVGYSMGTFHSAGGLLLLMLFMYTAYCAVTEGSAMHATLGKKAMGLVVTDLKRRPVSFGSACVREIAKVTIGWLSAPFIPFTQRKQGFHDLIAGTLVMRLR